MSSGRYFIKHLQNIIYMQEGYRLFQTLTDYFVGLVLVIISFYSWLIHTLVYNLFDAKK